MRLRRAQWHREGQGWEMNTYLVFPWLLLLIGVRTEEEVAEVMRNQRDLKDS